MKLSIWADGSIEAARIARMATAGGASALLLFPPAPFALGQSPQMALTHFSRIAEASDLSIISSISDGKRPGQFAGQSASAGSPGHIQTRRWRSIVG
jgi:hypothetical protein